MLAYKTVRHASLVMVGMLTVVALASGGAVAAPTDGILGGNNPVGGILGGDSGIGLDPVDGVLGGDSGLDGSALGNTSLPVGSDGVTGAEGSSAGGVSGLADDGQLVGSGLPVDTANLTYNLSSVPVDQAPEMGGQVEGQKISLGDSAVGSVLQQAPGNNSGLPVNADQLAGPVGPEDSPLGSSGAINYCGYVVTPSDLPTEAVPAPGTLPVNYPMIPTQVLTPGSVSKLGYYLLVPPGCLVYDASNPAVDPTDPPRDPSAQMGMKTFEINGDRVLFVKPTSSGELAPGGPNYSSVLAVDISKDDDVTVATLNDVSNGKLDEYFGFDSRVSYDPSTKQFVARTKSAAVASQYPVALRCDFAMESGTFEEAATSCSPQGPVPLLVTPEVLVSYLQDPSVGDERPIVDEEGAIDMIPAQELLNL